MPRTIPDKWIIVVSVEQDIDYVGTFTGRLLESDRRWIEKFRDVVVFNHTSYVRNCFKETMKYKNYVLADYHHHSLRRNDEIAIKYTYIHMTRYMSNLGLIKSPPILDAIRRQASLASRLCCGKAEETTAWDPAFQPHISKRWAYLLMACL